MAKKTVSKTTAKTPKKVSELKLVVANLQMFELIDFESLNFKMKFVEYVGRHNSNELGEVVLENTFNMKDPKENIIVELRLGPVFHPRLSCPPSFIVRMTSNTRRMYISILKEKIDELNVSNIIKDYKFGLEKYIAINSRDLSVATDKDKEKLRKGLKADALQAILRSTSYTEALEELASLYNIRTKLYDKVQDCIYSSLNMVRDNIVINKNKAYEFFQELAIERDLHKLR